MSKEIKKDSMLSATYRFRNELKEFGLPQDLHLKFIRDFISAFHRSDDYDLAANRVFEEVMRRVSRKNSSFKSVWRGIARKKIDITKENIEVIENRAKELAAIEKPEVSPWQTVFKIAKILVVEFFITLVAAIAIARKVSSK